MPKYEHMAVSTCADGHMDLTVYVHARVHLIEAGAAPHVEQPYSLLSAPLQGNPKCHCVPRAKPNTNTCAKR